ncbi:MAG TPA: phospholipase D-like domain-containing protein [Patescibacteria group bacterium]|nr:phospholipase D-like domain-containing protein [Patescibacteria group bacterium]
MSNSDFQVYQTSTSAWEAMFQAVEAARKNIYWELYIFLDDDAGRPFFELLERKAREGVEVKVIVDALGSFWLSRRRINSLREAGVDIRFFHERQHRYRGLWRRLVSRTHRKILIIDEQIGFIGGVNIGRHMADWHDIHLRLSGFVVRSLLRAFAKSYIMCGGPRSAVRHLLKYRLGTHDKEIDFVFDDAGKRSRVRKKYTEAVRQATKRVILFTPYYFPDRKFLFALWQARKRGVRIDLLIPFRSDVRLAQYAAFAWFALMRKLGVRVFLSETMFHGKGMIIDRKQALVGSSNLDQTSFYDNYEANVDIHDPRLVKILHDTVNRWLRLARPLDQKKWERRGWVHKLKEKIAWRILHLWHKREKIDF